MGGDCFPSQHGGRGGRGGRGRGHGQGCGGPAISAKGMADHESLVDRLLGEESVFLPNSWLVDS